MPTLLRLTSASLLLSTCYLWGSGLSLTTAMEILEKNNLEIKAAALDAETAQKDVSIAKGYSYGSLDLTQSAIRSNDPGNVFGFKLSERGATFGDFGFDQFLTPLGAAIQNPSLINQMGSVLNIVPNQLNYPGYQNFYQTKLTYMVPLYAGGKLNAYEEIAKKMEQIKQLDSKSVINEKQYELRKSYFDMGLLNSSIKQMTRILSNVSTLELTTEMMLKEGYAKKVDLLEVQSKKSDVLRALTQLNANKKLLLHYISFLLNQSVDDIEAPTNDYPFVMLDKETLLNSNLDIQKASNGLEVRKKMVDVAYAPFLPQVGAFAETSSADNTFLGNFSEHKAYTVGAKLSWNFFNGGIDKENLEKAKIEKLKTKTQVELAKQGIVLQYDKIKTDIINLDAQITNLEKELELANQIYRNYEGRYQEHLVSMNDLLIKQSQQIEKILTLQMVKNQRNERVFALEKLSNGVKQ